jgi:hypothetical protein
MNAQKIAAKPKQLVAGATPVRGLLRPQLDDFLLCNAIVESDPQLPTQGYVRAQDCRDRHRDQKLQVSP